MRKFFYKIKLFLRSNPSSLSVSVLTILTRCQDYLNSEKPNEEIANKLHDEIAEFIMFVFNEVNFDLEKPTDVTLGFIKMIF
jgi:hypothetical protein